MVSRLHATVKHCGKEAATYRFARREKTELMELVYRYGKRGYRTSENEIVRIAVNWMLEEHKTRAKRGVLHLVLRALHQ